MESTPRTVESVGSASDNFDRNHRGILVNGQTVCGSILKVFFLILEVFFKRLIVYFPKCTISSCQTRAPRRLG